MVIVISAIYKTFYYSFYNKILKFVLHSNVYMSYLKVFKNHERKKPNEAEKTVLTDFTIIYIYKYIFNLLSLQSSHISHILIITITITKNSQKGSRACRVPYIKIY
jgi:hypothetical protein